MRLRARTKLVSTQTKYVSAHEKRSETKKNHIIPEVRDRRDRIAKQKEDEEIKIMGDRY